MNLQAWKSGGGIMGVAQRRPLHGLGIWHVLAGANPSAPPPRARPAPTLAFFFSAPGEAIPSRSGAALDSVPMY